MPDGGRAGFDLLVMSVLMSTSPPPRQPLMAGRRECGVIAEGSLNDNPKAWIRLRVAGGRFAGNRSGRRRRGPAMRHVGLHFGVEDDILEAIVSHHIKIRDRAATRVADAGNDSMGHVAKFAEINEEKMNFDSIYTSDDPRRYFSKLGELDYIIPHLAQPIIEQVIRARAAVQTEPVTVLDLGCSYGVNGALMKYALSFDSLQQRYIAPALQQLSSNELLALDQAYYRSWPRHDRVRVIGLDVSAEAVRYAQRCGTVDVGLSANLEMRDPAPEETTALADVDLIVSTGCVGYVTSRTFERLAQVTRRGRPAWVVSFVLRMFPYDKIAGTLDELGLVTEKFEGTTFVQRRFASRDEMEAAVRAVEGRGIDSRGHESDGLYHADLYVSRPLEEVERCPIQKLVSVVSGANKPWTVGTHLLGRFGETARRRARDRWAYRGASTMTT